MADETLRCCPQCGSAAVDFGVLNESQASCGACKWEGGANTLLTIPASEVDTNLQLMELVRDLRAIMSKKLGEEMLVFLVKWGFVAVDPKDIAGTLDRKVFSRYLAGMSHALLKSVLETRRQLVQDAKGVHN